MTEDASPPPETDADADERSAPDDGTDARPESDADEPSHRPRSDDPARAGETDESAARPGDRPATDSGVTADDGDDEPADDGDDDDAGRYDVGQTLERDPGGRRGVDGVPEAGEEEVDDGEPGEDGRPGSDDGEHRPADAESVDETDASAEAEPADETDEPANEADEPADDVPEDVRKYERFKKMDGAEYERVNQFLRDRTYITAREWAIARLCADFRTETGVEMTKIGENLPELVPFMTDTYTPQAVNQARSSFEEKVRKAGATFLYGAMSDFLTAEEVDDLMYEVTEVSKFLLEVEGVNLSVEEELETEDRISSVMRDVRQSSEQLRHEEVECPNCGHTHELRDD